MEVMGVGCFLDEEWESLYKIFSVEPDLDFALLLGHNSYLPADHLPPDEQTILVPNSNHFSQSNSTSYLSGSSNGGTSDVNTLNHMTQLIKNDDQISCLPLFGHSLMENDLMENTTMIQGLSSRQMGNLDDQKKSKSSDQIEMEPKKRARVFKQRDKGMRKMQPKKKQVELADEEKTNVGSINVQNSSCDGSDNESDASQEVIKEASKENLNGNRASRGAATDPQSLYARRRRQRINERLRILQNLVPNGTKVDISTMLEEAVHYVRFLQLQIKLLSSDELWMYAPLAYNGFDVDFYSRFSPYL